MSFLPIDEQLVLIRRGAEEIIPEDILKKKLERSKETDTPLIIKLGCDPSRPDLHIIWNELMFFRELWPTKLLM